VEAITAARPVKAARAKKKLEASWNNRTLINTFKLEFAMPILFTIQRNGREFRARADGGAAFFVGNQTSYSDKSSGTDFEGLYNVPSQALPRLLYDAAAQRGAHGFWADLIAPTARCEGNNFLTLNTYDRARFTWGFGQFAAHVPDGDFVRYFRDILQRTEVPEYFPNLAVRNGRIVKLSRDLEIPLETASDTRGLMDYLNPTNSAIEDAEVIAAAKLIHWSTQIPAMRDLQVAHMVATFRRLMKESDSRLGLDGRSAAICAVVCDIRHQGRAKYAAMLQALAQPDPLAALLKLGAIAYGTRIKTLRRALTDAEAIFAGKVWNRAQGDFK